MRTVDQKVFATDVSRCLCALIHGRPGDSSLSLHTGKDTTNQLNTQRASINTSVTSSLLLRQLCLLYLRRYVLLLSKLQSRTCCGLIAALYPSHIFAFTPICTRKVRSPFIVTEFSLNVASHQQGRIMLSSSTIHLSGGGPELRKQSCPQCTSHGLVVS